MKPLMVCNQVVTGFGITPYWLSWQDKFYYMESKSIAKQHQSSSKFISAQLETNQLLLQ